MSNLDLPKMICLDCVDRKKYAVIDGIKVPLCEICGKEEERIKELVEEKKMPTWAMNNILKTIDMHLRPRIEKAQDREDIWYCQGMLDAVSDFLTEELYREIQSEIYSKRLAMDKQDLDSEV